MSLPWFIILLSLTQNPEPFRAHFLFNQQYIAVRIICRIPILHYKSCLLSMIKGAVPKGWHLKPPPRYGAEPLSLMPHTQNRLIQVIYQCSLQKPPSQMLLGQQPTQRKRAWNANCVQTQSGGYDGHFRSASVAFPQKGRGACVGGTVGSLPHVERSASERITPPQRTASKGSRSPLQVTGVPPEKPAPLCRCRFSG